MNELAPMNVRTEPRDDVRRTAAHRTVRESRQSEARFVAARPASVPPVPSVTSLRYAPSPALPGPRPAFPVADRTERDVPVDRSRRPEGGRAALLIGTAIHDHDDDFPELPSAGAGVRHMKHVLERPDVGMMDTCLVIGDATRVQMMRGIEAFLEERESDDTVVVYVSGYAAVSQRDARQYLVAKDTDPGDLEHTGVPVDFLSRQLRECRAEGKIVLLDHCLPPSARPAAASGGVLATPSGVTPPGAVMPEPAGVHVIAASPVLGVAAGADPESAMGASAFTTEIVEGLSTGRVTSGLGPWVTADDLAGYLTERLYGPDARGRREPATSALAVTGSHVVARSAVRALSLLGGDDVVTERALSAAVPKTTRWSRGGPTEVPGWRELITYYRACLADSCSPYALPPRDATPGDHVPIGSGAEVLLCGASATAAAPPDVDTFDWKERELWYGYPLVTLAGGGRRHSSNPLAQVGVAPLLVQRVDVTVDSRGAPALRPTGPVVPHAGVLHACVDEQEAASVLASWRQSWEPGDHGRMLTAVRQLMKRLGLSEASPLDPTELSADGLAAATRTEVHNAAGVLYAESKRTAAVAAMAELATVADHAADISGTVLEHLNASDARTVPEDRAADGSVTAPVMVTPDELNESHEQVLESAMRRALTVATTPPGTGSTQLIVDVVATAVAAGQKVLVVAPEDRSLRAVVERCAQLAPGLMIRTGDAQARAEEKQLLRELLRSSRAQAPRRSGDAVSAELSEARAALEAWRGRLAERVRLETTLRKTYSARAAAAERLGMDVAVLESAWDGDDTAMATWLERARSLDDVRFLHDRRRGRAAAAYLRVVSGDVDPAMVRRAHAEPDVFDALVLFVRAEQRVREIRREIEQVSDEQLEDTGHALTERCRRLSTELVDAVVADRTARAQPQLDARRMALEPGGRARQDSQRELADVLGGWAVTLDGAEQLAMDPGMFDLVVVADAHEASVASVLPVLFRARRALVLGDPVRRRTAVTISDHRHRRAREQGGLSASWLEQRRLTYQADSAFDAAAARVTDVALLDEHDGCHPGIARIVDESLYDGRLTVLTDVGSLRRARDPETGQSTLLLWEDVQGSPEPGPNGGSWRNQAEIDRVVWAVNELRDQLPPDATIGVMTPFRAQAEELRSLFRFEPVPVVCADEPDPEVCDAMVVSLVVGESTPAQTVRWVESRAAMWNACLTRARSHVIAVGRHQFWTQRDGLAGLLARQSSVRSFHVSPIPPERPEPTTEPDALVDLLEERLLAAGHTQLERHAVLDGFRCDMLVGTANGVTAVLLDRGAPAGNDPARHLRLLFRRRRLLVGTQADTVHPIGRVTQVLRVPAWRVRSGERIPGLI